MLALDLGIQKRLSEQKEEAIQKLHDLGIVLNVDYKFQGIYLVGSQNYHLHHEKSDVDSTMVIVPTYTGYCNGKNFVRTLDLSNKEHVSVKPFIDHVRLMCKGSPHSLEMLVTPYFEANNFIHDAICNHYLDYFFKFGKEATIRTSFGIMQNNIKSLMKKEVGNDSLFRQASHIYRLSKFLDKFWSGASYEDSIRMTDTSHIEKYHAIRAGNCSFGELKSDCRRLVEEKALLIKNLGSFSLEEEKEIEENILFSSTVFSKAFVEKGI